MTYTIYIAKKRCPEDRYGISWGKVELPDYDEEKAIAKYDFLRIMLGDTFVVTLSIKEMR